MSEEKKKSFNRRDFFTAGASAIIGAGLFGAIQKDESSSTSPERDPASQNNSDPRNMANDHRNLKGHYPVLIIGSGYGGSVLAARLSEAGKKVCILERGKEWHPGMFPQNGPESSKAGRTNLNPLGLIDSNLHRKSDVDIICASGLGGTSLLNAAIASRPEKLVFQQKEWPREIREAFERGQITHFMDKAQGILKSTKHSRTMEMPKAMIHKKMTEELGLPFNELLLNVNHTVENGEKNACGIPQNACTLCGDCCSGCNVGAKNVLTVNYLPMAKARGAEIYTSIEVNHVVKEKNGKYSVHYVWYGGFLKSPRKGVITTDMLIMAAGSMGSTQIMMRSKLKGLRLPNTLGTRFSANGDVMGLSYNGNGQSDMLGYGLDDRINNPSGQAISVYADYRKNEADSKMANLMQRYLLLDGTVPKALGPLVAKGLAAWALANPGKFTDEQKQKARRDLFDTQEPDLNGALNSSLIFFACGHDSATGRYILDDYDDRVHVRWPNVVNEESFQFINREMEKFAKIHGGVYVPNPRMTVFGHRMMATHPLGGCPMGADANSGVVDHLGRVYDEDGSIHKGFYIVDAAIIPRSLGATPLITISALAERIATFINADPESNV